MNSSSIQTLMAQLQARYPTASLTSDLLTIHQGSYVVRAAVHIGHTILTTGLAAAIDIEQAEDRAKHRALECLGIGSVSSIASSQGAGYALMASPLFQGATDLTSPETVTPSLPIDSPLPPPIETPDRIEPLIQPEGSTNLPRSKAVPNDLTPQPVPEASFSPQSDFDYSSTDYSSTDYSSTDYSSTDYSPDYAPIQFEPADEAPYTATSEALIEPPPTPTDPSLATASSDPPDPTVSSTPEFEAEESSTKARSTAAEKTTAPKKTTKRKAEPIEAPQPNGAADRSEEIAKIGLEMKRLGWTTEQGRNYLKRTYGKRSRQELDDAELIDFLRYLEFQPSPSESPF
jgi:hypothetical protein